MSSTHIMIRSLLPSIAAVALAMGCGGTEGTTPDARPDALAMCIPNGPAPTFTQLYTKYFAAGVTRGHCANEDCHGDTSFNLWSCGSTKDKCYSGMVGYGLIDTVMPLSSRIANPTMSPLFWINQDTGFMPADDVRPYDEGRDAILAWIRACAPNN